MRDRADYERRRNSQAAFRARKKIYSSAQWQECRQTIMTERVFCELCKAQGRLVAGGEVHHKVDLSKGGAPYDPDNLMLLCESCHSSITSSGGRIKGCDVNGQPLDPRHHWNAK